MCKHTTVFNIVSLIWNPSVLKPMYCTICKLEINTLDHYKSNIHNINARRKLYGYPPVMFHELDTESLSDDLSIDLNLSREDSETEKESIIRASSMKCAGKYIKLGCCSICKLNYNNEKAPQLYEFTNQVGGKITSRYCEICHRDLAEPKTPEADMAQNTGNGMLDFDENPVGDLNKPLDNSKID